MNTPPKQLCHFISSIPDKLVKLKGVWGKIMEAVRDATATSTPDSLTTGLSPLTSPLTPLCGVVNQLVKSVLVCLGDQEEEEEAELPLACEDVMEVLRCVFLFVDLVVYFNFFFRLSILHQL